MQIFSNFNAQQVRRNIPQFFQQLQIFPASFAFRQDIQKGDKILLPTSALNQLYQFITGRNKDPMIFCIKHGNRMTYCGVLEFVAQQGLCYLPNWMYKMLNFKQPGTPATVTLVPDLKKKNQKQSYFIKLRPHLTEFIQLQRPKAVLQYQLRNFTCLHQGDTITISSLNKKFQIDILEIKPPNQYNAICIIDADVEVDFAPPLDYQEQTKDNIPQVIQNSQKSNNIFTGNGVRLDGKVQTRKVSQIPDQDQYDPRKHRIHRGVRKINQHWIGKSVNISQPIGTKKK